MSLMRSDIQNQMDRMFNDLTRGFMFPQEVFGGRVWPAVTEAQQGWMPAIEVTENDNDYTVRAELPGVKPEDVDVEVAGNILTISGQTFQEQKSEERNVHRSELRYGRFLRRIPLPGDVKSENAKADFHHGVLVLNLPKAEESKRKRIKVSGGK